MTVTRLADDRFRVVTGAGYLASEMAWLRTHLADDDGPVAIRDDSGELATIGLWGPRARDILAAAVAIDDVGDAAIPLRRARSIRVGPAPVLASRISYAGELGWELTTDAEWAVGVWDALDGGRRGARARAIRLPGARRAPDGEGLPLLRHGPDDARHAGRGRTRVPSSGSSAGPFIGREALVAARDAQPDGPSRRLRTLLIGDAAYLPVYGGEAVRRDGEVIGRLRSVAYGPTVERTIGYAYLPAGLAEGDRLEVDVFDRRAAAVVAPDVLVDPAGAPDARLARRSS